MTDLPIGARVRMKDAGLSNYPELTRYARERAATVVSNPHWTGEVRIEFDSRRNGVLGRSAWIGIKYLEPVETAQ